MRFLAAAGRAHAQPRHLISWRQPPPLTFCRSTLHQVAAAAGHRREERGLSRDGAGRTRVGLGGIALWAVRPQAHKGAAWRCGLVDNSLVAAGSKRRCRRRCGGTAAATAHCGPPTYHAPAYPQAPPEEPRQPPHRGPSRLSEAASRLGSLLTAPEDSNAWLAVGDGEDASPRALKGSPTATADGSHGHSDRLKSAEEGTEDGLQLEGKPAPRGAATFGAHHGVLVSEDTFKQGGCSKCSNFGMLPELQVTYNSNDRLCIESECCVPLC